MCKATVIKLSNEHTLICTFEQEEKNLSFVGKTAKTAKIFSFFNKLSSKYHNWTKNVAFGILRQFWIIAANEV